MNRREALKQLGLGTAGAAIAVSGLASVSTACSPKKAGKNGSRIVFFFTGTGNCLHVARQFTDKPLSIPQVMKGEDLTFEADEIGIVYPIYSHMPPKMVQEFMEKATLRAKYFWAIATYGNRSLNAAELFDEIARRQGLQFNYITSLLMVDNFLPNFDMNDEMRKEKKEDRWIEYIKRDIDERKDWIEPATEEQRQMHWGDRERVIPTASERRGMNPSQMFEVTDACVRCEACISVCPKGNLSLQDEKITYSGDCEMCFACVQNCPQKAIKLRMRERNPEARYRNKHVSLRDIQIANKQ